MDSESFTDDFARVEAWVATDLDWRGVDLHATHVSDGMPEETSNTPGNPADARGG